MVCPHAEAPAMAGKAQPAPRSLRRTTRGNPGLPSGPPQPALAALPLSSVRAPVQPTAPSPNVASTPLQAERPLPTQAPPLCAAEPPRLQVSVLDSHPTGQAAPPGRNSHPGLSVRKVEENVPLRTPGWAVGRCQEPGC